MDEASPRFRTDLEAAATEADGVACVDVSDPHTGTSFRFYDFEYQLALQLNGQPLAAVTAWAKDAYDVELTTEGVAEFAGRLAELGFLEGRPAAAAEITDMGTGPVAVASTPDTTDPGLGPARDAEIGDGPAGRHTATAPMEITDMGSGDSAATAMPTGGALIHTELADSADSGEVEWTSSQASKTATFVPDTAMLTSPDRTPVAPNMPFLEEAEQTPAPGTIEPARTAPTPNVPALGGPLPPSTAAGSPPASAAATPPPVLGGPAPPATTAGAPPLSAAATPPPVLGGPAPPATAAGVPPLSAAATPPPALGGPPVPATAAVPPPLSAGATPPPSPLGLPASVAVTRPSEAPTIRLPPSERSVAVTRPSEAPTLPGLPSSLAGPASPASPGATGAEPSKPPAWAAELEGTLGGGASKPGAGGPGSTKPPAVPGSPLGPGTAPDRLGLAPTGQPERRQPPKPDAVVMSGFSGEDERRAGAKKSSAKVVVAVVLLAVVAAAVGYVVWSRSQIPEPHALRVRAVAPKPTAVYRWFSGHGVVVEAEPRTLGFDGPGRLVELLPAGAEFGAGEILGRLEGSAAIETLLAHHRSRLAFHEQMRDSMRAAGNAIEARQAELKLADKQRLIAETHEALARVTLQTNEPGEVVETLAKVGAQVKAGAPVVRIKGRLLHGEFRFEADELEAARKLAFCRVEVIGLGPHASNAEPRRPSDPVADAAPPGAQGAPRFVDCSAPVRATGRLTVALPSDVGLVPGQPLRLARGRLDAVFPIPAAALDGDGAERAVWIAGRDGRAERRPVTVAGVDGDEAYVGGGLRVGDDVIVEAPAGLAPGARIAALH